MKLIKTMSTVLCTLTALCGCLPQENPDRIYTIVLENGETQRTLKIPGAYLPEKEKNNSSGVWVQFSYPSMKPVVSRTPTDDSIELRITPTFDDAKPSMSEFIFNQFQNRIKKYGRESSVRYVGKIENYEAYEEINTRHGYISRTYFRRDQSGNLISIDATPGLRTTSQKRYADSLELNYGYSPSLMTNEAEIDAAITKLVESWLEK